MGTLNEDILLTEKHGKYDMTFRNGDIVNVIDNQSLVNAVTIAIMTRYKELADNPIYEGFGCRVHENIKKNKSSLLVRVIEGQVLEVLGKMRRIKDVESLNITPTDDGYTVEFTVILIDDNDVYGRIVL